MLFQPLSFHPNNPSFSDFQKQCLNWKSNPGYCL